VGKRVDVGINPYKQGLDDNLNTGGAYGASGDIPPIQTICFPTPTRKNILQSDAWCVRYILQGTAEAVLFL
jgi:hypothetical protein